VARQSCHLKTGINHGHVDELLGEYFSHRGSGHAVVQVATELTREMIERTAPCLLLTVAKPSRQKKALER